MTAANQLRALAAKCRNLAGSTRAVPTRETLLEMARQFDESADASDRMPMISAHPTRGGGE